MKVRFQEGQQRSGSLGGTVASHNRFGAYLRARSVPVNPNTDRQVAVRNDLRNLTIAWQTVLTQGERDAWELYASNVPWTDKFGESVYLTGLNMYVRTNAVVLQCGGTRIDTAPAIFNLAQAEGSLVGSASEATQQVSIAYDDTATWCSEDGALEAVYMGKPVNPAIKFYGGPWRFLDSIDGDSVTPPTSPALLATAWPFVAGQRIWVQTRIMRADGRLSELARHNFLSAA